MYPHEVYSNFFAFVEGKEAAPVGDLMFFLIFDSSMFVDDSHDAIDIKVAFLFASKACSSCIVELVLLRW